MPKLIDNLLEEIKENRAIYGSKVALKKLKKGIVEKIYIANDCSLDIEEKLKEAKANIIKLDVTKEMLKDMCKTQFNISVVSIIKEGEKGKAESSKEEKEEKGEKKREKKNKKKEDEEESEEK